jgi:hypothetical protein
MRRRSNMQDPGASQLQDPEQQCLLVMFIKLELWCHGSSALVTSMSRDSVLITFRYSRRCIACCRLPSRTCIRRGCLRKRLLGLRSAAFWRVWLASRLSHVCCIIIFRIRRLIATTRTMKRRERGLKSVTTVRTNLDYRSSTHHQWAQSQQQQRTLFQNSHSMITLITAPDHSPKTEFKGDVHYSNSCLAS